MVMIWPVWRWVWSATWIMAPPKVVGSCLRPMARWVARFGCGQSANARFGVGEGGFEFDEQRREGFAACGFGFECGELLRAKLVSLGVGKDAVSGASQMAKVEGDGGKAERLGLNFKVGEARGPLPDVIDGQVKSVENGAAGGRDFSVCAAEPGFRVGGGNWGSAHTSSLKRGISQCAVPPILPS